MSKIKFKTKIDETFKISETRKVQLLFNEIDSYIKRGCRVKYIYESLIESPINLDLTFGSFEVALHRIRKRKDIETGKDRDNTQINDTENEPVQEFENAFARLKTKKESEYKYNNCSTIDLDEIFGTNKSKKE